MSKFLLCVAVNFSIGVSSLHAAEYRAIFWNMESGESDDSFLADQMAEKGLVDLWCLSEVRNQTALDRFEEALDEMSPDVDYIAKLSEDGRGDRLAILYRSDRFEAVAYSGDATIDAIGQRFFEVDSINDRGTVRPGLAIQLRSTESALEFIVMVNHWKCCGGSTNQERRANQAIQMTAFAIASDGIPVVSGGDFNIPFNRGGQANAAFQHLIERWEFREPQPGVGSYKGGTVLDGVFLTNHVTGWDWTVTILKRSGNEEATSSTFDDSDDATDHRPLLLVVQTDSGDRIEELREQIDEARAALVRMEAELEELLDNE